MLTSTNVNTVVPASKMLNFGGTELNSSAIKGIMWNILDERPHKAYLAKLHKTSIVRRQLLQTLAITAGIRHQVTAVVNLSTNSYCAAVTLSHPLRALKIDAFDHISEMIRELSIASNINAKEHAHAITMKIIDMLEALPREGNQSEIEAADRMIKAYRHPIPTRPSTPENVEMEPIPVPAPRPTRSAWQNVLQELQFPVEPNKENVPPTHTPISSSHPISWNSPALMIEVDHLRHYFTGLPPPSAPTVLKLTNQFVFIDHDESKSSRNSYWNLVLSKFFNEGEKIDRYKGKIFRFAEAGVDNTKLFIGMNDRTSTWYFAKDKRSLFSVLDGGIF